MVAQKYWLACAEDDASSILSDGYRTRRRKYIPLAVGPAEALTAFRRYNADKRPAFLLVDICGNTAKPRGKGFALHVKHLPGKCFKQRSLADCLNECIKSLENQQKTRTKLEAKVKDLKEENKELQKEADEMEELRERLDEFEIEVDDLRAKNKELQDDAVELREKIDELETEVDDLRKENDDLQAEADEAEGLQERVDELEGELELHRGFKRRWKRGQKKLQEVIEEVEESIEEEFSEYFSDICDEIVSTATSEADLDPLPLFSINRYHSKLGSRFLEEPDLHDCNHITDQATKLIKKEHDMALKVVKVWKVNNEELEARFRQRCKDLIADDPEIVMKFHGTKLNNAAKILSDGFKLPSKAGVYGKGIYVATDSSKSALYTKGDLCILLVCKVALGNVLQLNKRDKSLTSETLSLQGFDSVYAPRDSKDSGGVFNDEFVVYKPDQILPAFVVLFQKVAGVLRKKKETLMSTVQEAKDFILEKMQSFHDIDSEEDNEEDEEETEEEDSEPDASDSDE